MAVTAEEREALEAQQMANEMLGESGQYKIHNIGTADGRYRQSPTGRFYGSLPRAQRAALTCFSSPPRERPDGSDGAPCEGIVIYKAIKVILPKVDDSTVDIIDLVLKS